MERMQPPLDLGRSPSLARVFGRLRARLDPGPVSALVAVGQRYDREGWKVALIAGGETLAALDAAAARALAADLNSIADVIEGAE